MASPATSESLAPDSSSYKALKRTVLFIGTVLPALYLD